jgi:hypothetical protein
MNSLRRHLSYANIVATLALVFAMSGGALAASQYLINSPKQINPKVLKKLKGNSGKTGPTGLQGAAGLQGPAGPLGPKGAEGAKGVKGEEGPEGPKGETGPAGQARAYAIITPGSPATVQAGSRGVVSATTFSGVTCVFLEPSINLATAVAIVTSHFGDLTFSGWPGACATGGKEGVQVNGYNQDGTVNTTSAFSILVS